MHHLQGTGLAANFMATHMDPQIWESPEQFSPHRFFSIIVHIEDKIVVVITIATTMIFLIVNTILVFRFLNEDETGLKDTPHFFPFSVGKRVLCKNDDDQLSEFIMIDNDFSPWATQYFESELLLLLPIIMSFSLRASGRLCYVSFFSGLFLSLIHI